MERQFANEDIVAANERMVLTDPFDPACKSNQFPAELGTLVQELRWVLLRGAVCFGTTGIILGHRHSSAA